MRFRFLKTSRTRNLLFGDSQAKKLNIASFNILSLPGGQVKHVYEFLPKKTTTILLFFSLEVTIYSVVGLSQTFLQAS